MHPRHLAWSPTYELRGSRSRGVIRSVDEARVWVQVHEHLFASIYVLTNWLVAKESNITRRPTTLVAALDL